MSRCRYIKFLNIAIVIAMLVAILPMQAYAAPERLPIVRMTGGITFNGRQYVAVGDAIFSTNAKIKPTSITIIKNGRPMTARLNWEGSTTKMFLIEGIEFLYFNSGEQTLAYQVIPQGMSRRVWQETDNRNAICPKPCN